MSTNSPQAGSPSTTEVVFGEVVNVRAVPTRGVTQIVIEVPSEYHTAITSMLFGKNAYVFAANPASNPGAAHPKSAKPFGIYPLDKIDEEPAPVAAVVSQAPTANGRNSILRMNGLRVTVNISQWLGIQCQSKVFMDWIGAETASAAVEMVRNFCGVTSRNEIAGSEQAIEKFTRLVYAPFIEASRQAHG